jgi:hypothetical protein
MGFATRNYYFDEVQPLSNPISLCNVIRLSDLRVWRIAERIRRTGLGAFGIKARLGVGIAATQCKPDVRSDKAHPPTLTRQISVLRYSIPTTMSHLRPVERRGSMQSARRLVQLISWCARFTIVQKKGAHGRKRRERWKLYMAKVRNFSF